MSLEGQTLSSDGRNANGRSAVSGSPSARCQASGVRRKMVYRGGCGSHLDDESASPFSDDSGLRSADPIIKEGAIDDVFRRS